VDFAEILEVIAVAKFGIEKYTQWQKRMVIKVCLEKEEKLRSLPYRENYNSILLHNFRPSEKFNT
jgi:hypothetical protein